MPARASVKGKLRDSYLDLIRKLPLASIEAEEHLEEAQEMIDSLLSKSALDAGEEMYLEALSDLVALYEDEAHPIPPASDADMLRHLIEAKCETQAGVARGTGIPRSTISEILSGKRPISRANIGKLAAYFGMDAGVLAANI